MYQLPEAIKNEYDKLEVLANRQFSVLFTGVHQKTYKTHCIKVSLDPETTANLNREYEFLKEHAHPLFPNVHGLNPLDQNKALQVREYVPGQTLEQFAGKLPEQEILSIATQIARGLAAIHHLGYCYGDISANNFIYNDTKITFIDFEFVAKRHDEAVNTRGTPSFMAPELFYGNGPTIQSDLYALGALLFYLITGKPPFKGETYQELIEAHLLETLPNPAKVKNNCSEELGFLILRLLNKEPAERFLEANDFIKAINQNFETHFELEPKPESLQAQEKIRAFSNFSLVSDTIKKLEQKKNRPHQESSLLAGLYLKTNQIDKLKTILTTLEANEAKLYEANIYNTLGQYNESISLLTDLKEKNVNQQKVILLTATANYHLGKIELAQKELDTAIQKAKNEKNDESLSLWSNHLGNFLLFGRQIAQAINHFEKAYQAAGRAGVVQLEALSLMNLANAHLVKNNWVEALKCYEKAKRIFDLCGNQLEQTRVALNLAGLYRFLGHLDKSRALIEEAQKFILNFPNRHLELYACLLESDLEKKIKNHTRALLLLKKAEELLEENFTSSEMGDLLISQIELSLDTEDSDQILELIKKTNDFLEKQKDPLVQKRLAILEKQNELSKKSETFEISSLVANLKEITNLGDIEFALDNIVRASRLCEKNKKYEDYEILIEYLNDLLKFCDKKLPADYREHFFFFYRQRPQIDTHKHSQSFLLNRILETTREVMSELNINMLVKKILHFMMEVTHTDRGFVILGEEEARISYTHKMDSQRLVTLDNPDMISWTLTNKVLQDRKPLITIDALGDERFVNTHSVHKLKLRSIVILPFIFRGQVMGAVYLDSTLKSQQLSRDNLPYLEALADQIGIAIHNAKVFQKTTDKLDQVQKTLVRQERELRFKYSYQNFIGLSPNTLKIFSLLDKIIDTSVPVLIEGESGTGKEMIAKIIHYNSKRKDKHLVSVNCSAIPENLLESELFGHVRGSFTGATENKVGLFEHADGGTLFLDEIGDMPLAMQVKLLRAIQEGEIRAIGSNKTKKIDVRLISATNKNLKEEIKKGGSFREDLYYRLNVANILIPPLRDRKEDMPLLIDNFLKKFASENEGVKIKITPETLNILANHNWPGNVRELENTIYTLCLLAENGTITPEIISKKREFITQPHVEKNIPTLDAKNEFLREAIDQRDLSLAEAKQEFEKEQILRILKKYGGQVTKTAEHLQMQRTHLSRLLKRYHIQKK
ncbi:MAG: hypothetical protein A3G32_07490 [Deltaproteobacteria bacterium RIFCSPLOWO2_12_FULL_40_28]|nr:MAG: hypothetical protein A3C45_08165 [Deltaproteobacteria bacterium RIFCSPHIGHO2_02_FULL_40_28]OGQ20324.1 MAG: hypothetical protein A3E27_00030 [Deltaproteobacteria bacterium RIFCSPHIGHO2_12_FULL_40_32]OGQ40781.1 MAG: hypothetical protein A3I69_06710 [Deltaproteobacteria bacterium RIFCSPLOWO2_02_FULL_40_36]OGQ54931.1 MAG: hypothetical protein A3G32_07490 [Deltaproteobacteria bacterium RIFCSPLOWO2_12_FULL_40_28]